MSNRNLLLFSSSRVHGYEYLQYAENDIKNFLNKFNVKKILFIPYALSNHNCYTGTVAESFEKFGYKIEGITTKPDPVEAVKNAEAIYIGGGNTFRLLKDLYDKNLIEPIHARVLGGMPYMGASAGTNVSTCNISTTNDMPIVYPPSLNALNLVPFNINPHYLDVPDASNHHGETRDQRINQYHEVDNTPPVLGLKEGCILYVNGDEAKLGGISDAVLFQRGQKKKELKVGEDISYLLSQ